jgi:hypothetical protein
MKILGRLRMRWYLIRHHGDSLNRRVEVEDKLLKMAAGKLPLPTRDQCRKMALRLGVPT